MKSSGVMFNHLLFILLTAVSLQAGSMSGSEQRLLQTSSPYDSLKRVLEKMYDIDQDIRQKLGSAKVEERGQVLKQMQQVDSANQVQLKAILNQYGWLAKSKVGQKASDAIFFVVQHSDKELMKQYLPSLQKLSQQKEASPIHAAMMEDRLLMWEGKKQKYGTQGFSTPTRKTFIWPIQDPVKVNELRKQVGFSQTVEEYAKQLNATYNPEEQLPQTDK